MILRSPSLLIFAISSFLCIWRIAFAAAESSSSASSEETALHPMLARSHSVCLYCQATLEPTSNWRHFQWILDSSALQCNVSGQEYVVSPFVGKSKIREFNARIASSASTLCLKELRIDREPENQECPPKFSSASGFSYTPT
uniref:Uncharacterized protein n=1 Tax=Ditylenchus dipsaci TaxID=166011 RepID=A0A915DSG4_9BILA